MDRDEGWLPDGIDELLPPRASQFEQLSRRIIDQYIAWGYELAMPPLVEYLESLLTGTGSDLERETFKLTDQRSGRMIGIRSDLTPQMARIDACRLRRDLPVRLCYLGSVLHARAASVRDNRCLMQTGVELFGHAGIESDAEVIGLMLDTLRLAGFPQIHVELGHVGIVRHLIKQADLQRAQRHELYNLLLRKAGDELNRRLVEWSVPDSLKLPLSVLPSLHGGAHVLEEAGQLLEPLGDELRNCLQELRRLAELISVRMGEKDKLHFDLAEPRGYRYHTGVVFSAHVPGAGQSIAQGGRYDHIGRAFGRPRPATGFSTDAKALFDLYMPPQESPLQHRAILAPWSEDAALRKEVDRLRAAGEVVITLLPDQLGGAAEMGCDRELRPAQNVQGGWQVYPLKQ